MCRNRYDGIDEDIVRLVKQKARWAIRQGYFPRDDLEDLEQDMMLALVIADKGVDVNHRILAAILKRHLITKVRARLSEMRDCRKTVGLDRCNGQAASKNLATVLDNHIDLERVIGGLPLYLRETWALLCQFDKEDTAEMLGVSRRTVDRYVEQMRTALGGNGLNPN